MDARSSEGWFDVAYANVDDSASVSALGSQACLQQAGTFHARLRFRPLIQLTKTYFLTFITSLTSHQSALLKHLSGVGAMQGSPAKRTDLNRFKLDRRDVRSAGFVLA